MPPIISIGNIEQVDWRNETDCDFTLNSHVHVWQIPLDLNILAINDLAELLSADEHSRAGRYHQQADRERFMISRGALRMILGRYLKTLPANIVFEPGVNKKPFVKNAADISLHYNTSHSGNYVLIAVADTPVGIDVENLEPLFPYWDITEHSFSPPELAVIEQSADKLKTFYTLWTRKEALLKATAKGIDDDIKLIPSTEGEHTAESSIIASTQNWIVNSFEPDINYTCSLASHTSKILFWCFRLTD